MNKIKRLAKKKKRIKWNETETIVTETKNTEADTLKNDVQLATARKINQQNR